MAHKPKEDNAQHGRGDSRAASVRVFRGRLDGNGHGVADGAFDLLGHPALRFLFAENQTGDGEGQHNHRRDGKDGIKSQGGTEFESPGFIPLQSRVLQQSHDRHASSPSETAHQQRLSLCLRGHLPRALSWGGSCTAAPYRHHSGWQCNCHPNERIPLAARPPQHALDFPCSCVRIGSRLFSWLRVSSIVVAVRSAPAS